MKTWKHRIGILAGILTAVYLAACVYVWATQVDKIFDPAPTLAATPADLECTILPTLSVVVPV